eukprot:1186934-Prorocentrum_minimum.AAC.2
MGTEETRRRSVIQASSARERSPRHAVGGELECVSSEIVTGTVRIGCGPRCKGRLSMYASVAGACEYHSLDFGLRA